METHLLVTVKCRVRGETGTFPVRRGYTKDVTVDGDSMSMALFDLVCFVCRVMFTHKVAEPEVMVGALDRFIGLVHKLARYAFPDMVRPLE